MAYRIHLLIFLAMIFSSHWAAAQYDVPLYASYTTTAERAKLYNRLVHYSIESGLSLALSDSTEENWENAFYAIEFLLYQSPFTNAKVRLAFDSIETRSPDFQKSLLELGYSNYPFAFSRQVTGLLKATTDPKVFALCAEYLCQQSSGGAVVDSITTLLASKFGDQEALDPVLYMLQVHLFQKKDGPVFLPGQLLQSLLSPRFLPGQIVMYSLQRKNRDFPGIVLVRNREGHFIRDSDGMVFSVPQLARSISNLPFYLRNGNTPQGIYAMHGFGVSMSNFIGPTANVQLSMPVESSPRDFAGDSSLSDSTWSLEDYKQFLPGELSNFLPLFYSYYAGLAGRREIIAHGTAIDPKIYVHQPYFPMTPSEGCLSTKEFWNGKRTESDQQKLVNALLQAGGAKGYCLVIELDDRQSAVTLKDVLPFIGDR